MPLAAFFFVAFRCMWGRGCSGGSVGVVCFSCRCPARDGPEDPATGATRHRPPTACAGAARATLPRTAALARRGHIPDGAVRIRVRVRVSRGAGPGPVTSMLHPGQWLTIGALTVTALERTIRSCA